MNNNFFDRVEKKTNVKKEDILNLARSIQNKNLKKGLTTFLVKNIMTLS